MKISRGYRADYAIRACAFLGTLEDGARAKSREIASAMDIPERFLPQVMAALVKEGLVVSTAGPGGGYALGRDAERISLFDVVRAIEGPIENERCVITGGECSWDHACAAHAPLAAAREAFESSLASSSIADIARVHRAAHPAN